MNRYERLVGHMYSQLVTDLRRIMSRDKGDDEIVASVLLFKSYNESFYYVGTNVNPLIKPSDVDDALIAELKQITLLRTVPKLFWYLGAYFASTFGSRQLDFILDMSDELVAANASTFNLTYPAFKELKDSWRVWVRDNSDCFRHNAPAECPKAELLTYQSYVLANLLITMMPISVSENSRNSASKIYKALTDRNPSNTDDEEWIDPSNGSFRVRPNAPYRWVYSESSDLSYGQLFDLIEFILIQPVHGTEKERIIGELYASHLANNEAPEDLNIGRYDMSALAGALIHNNEFQGIVYVARMFNGQGFDEDDNRNFSNTIDTLQVRGRLNESGFVLAQLAVTRKNAPDWNEPSPLRILNYMHLFTSASAGIVLYEDEEERPAAHERYRKADTSEMETLIRNDAEEIKATIEVVLPLEERKKEALWFSSADSKCKRLLSLASNGEKHSNAVLLMSFSLPKYGTCYLILFYRQVTEKFFEDFPRSQLAKTNTQDTWSVYGKVFAERMQGSVERLIDSDCEHKQFIKYERETSLAFIGGLSLLTTHDVRNKFQPLIVTRLKTIADGLKDQGEVQRGLYDIAQFADRLLNQSKHYTIAFSEFFSLKLNRPELLSEPAWTFSPDNFVALCETLHRLYSSVDPGARNMEWVVEDRREVLLGINSEIMEFLLDQLISNANEADRNNQQISLCDRKYVLGWRNHCPESNNHSSNYVRISVWNAGTQIGTYIRRNAGKGILKNPGVGHTGLGFYFLEFALSRLGAYQYEDERHFKIENTSTPKGVEISFILPSSTIVQAQ